ncbi:MAG: DUF4296 domain-containing protein [Bacteroidales bacterium]|nr:DUF4296 domain-containing protein [Bacteroidales bacterium]
MKRKACIFLSLLLAFVLAGCSSKGVISERKMAKIQCDMFLADQYVNTTPQLRHLADTTALYSCILKAYGCTSEQYLASVEHYLDDIKTFEKILDRTKVLLEKRQKEIQKNLDRQAAAALPDSPEE